METSAEADGMEPPQENIPAAPASDARRWYVLALVCFAFFMVVLDFSVVNVALPTIQKALRFSPLNLQWIASAYALTFGGFLMLGGRAADLFGRRRVLLLGVGVFTLASLGAGFAGLQSVLIVCRALQGLGGALIAPTALSILTTTFAEGPERNRAMGIFGSVATGGFAAGNIVGGVLTASAGWRGIFFVNLPLGLLVCLLIPVLIKEQAAERPPVGFDLAGAIAITSGLMLLVYAFVGAGSLGWQNPQTLALMFLALLTLAGFLVLETRAASPLVPLRIFRQKTLTVANLIVLLVDGVNVTTLYLLSLYFQQVLGYHSLRTGLAFLPLALLMMLFANLCPRYVTRFGAKPVMVAGTLLTTASPLLLSRLSAGGNYSGQVLPALLILGPGIAAAITAGIIAATSGVPNEEQGLASGIIQTSQQIGGALTLALLVTLATTRTRAWQHGGAVVSKDALTAGFHAAFLAGAGISGLALLMALFVFRAKPDSPHD